MQSLTHSSSTCISHCTIFHPYAYLTVPHAYLTVLSHPRTLTRTLTCAQVLECHVVPSVPLRALSSRRSMHVLCMSYACACMFHRGVLVRAMSSRRCMHALQRHRHAAYAPRSVDRHLAVRSMVPCIMTCICIANLSCAWRPAWSMWDCMDSRTKRERVSWGVTGAHESHHYDPKIKCAVGVNESVISNSRW